MDILTNTWLIQFGSSFLAGIFILIISTLGLRKKRIKEYSQNVLNINSEIISSYRPLVAKDEPLNKENVEIIIRSMARKYTINEDDLYNYETLIEDIIREIQLSSYLTTEEINTKQNKLKKQLKKEKKKVEGKIPVPEADKVSFIKKLIQDIKIINVIISAIVILVGIILFQLLLQSYTVSTRQEYSTFFLFLIAVVIFAYFIIYLLSFKTVTIRGKKDEKNYTKK